MTHFPILSFVSESHRAEGFAGALVVGGGASFLAVDRYRARHERQTVEDRRGEERKGREIRMMGIYIYSLINCATIEMGEKQLRGMRMGENEIYVEHRRGKLRTSSPPDAAALGKGYPEKWKSGGRSVLDGMLSSTALLFFRHLFSTND
jgi:hypothetical protein